MKRIVLLLAASLLPGMAAAASGSADATADAAANATIAFYSGFPGSGGSQLAKVKAGSNAQASAHEVLARADSVVIDVSGHAYTFALDQAARAKGQAELDVQGALQASAHGKATIAAVVKELAQAQGGQQSLVVLTRDQGSGRVVLALYHPDGGNAGLRVKAADHATVWIHGSAHDYKVTSDGSGGTMAGVKVKGSNGQQTLTSTVADLETKVALNGSAKTGGGGDGSNGSSASGSAGLNVTVGGSN